MENRETRSVKAEWRRRMAEVRDGMPPSERERLSERLCALLENAALSPLRRSLGRPLGVCVYAPFRSEASPMSMVSACLDRGDRIFAPRMRSDGEGLELRRIGEPADWSPGRWGVPEPDPHRASLMEETESLDVVLVPGMAFNAEGGRVGYGGGYYDRLYEERRSLEIQGKTLWIGFAYSAQVVSDALPAEEHDLRLDGLATDEGVVWFNKGEKEWIARRSR